MFLRHLIPWPTPNIVSTNADIFVKSVDELTMRSIFCSFIGLKDSKPNLITLLLEDAWAAFDEGNDDCADACLGWAEVIVAYPIANLAFIAMLARFSLLHK